MSDGLGRGAVDGIPFIRVATSSTKVGWGRLYTYTVYVEKEIDVDERAFADRVHTILADPRGWIRGGKVAFQRVPKDGGTQLCLARPDTVDKLCAPLQTKGEVSCCNGSKVVLNVERWMKGVPHWTGPLRTYRQMVVNHEFGHRTGHGHASCGGMTELAPVMMQQTYGLGQCRENPWPLDSEL